MLKIKYTAIAWLFLLVVLISSCKQSAPDQTKYIPKDASFVLSINPKTLKEKLDNNKISLDSIMRSAFSGDTSFLLTGEEIAGSGINLSKDVYFFVTSSGSIMNGSSVTTGFAAALDKISAFEAFVKKKSPQSDIKKESNYSYATLKNGFVVGWNDDVVLMTNVAAYSAQNGAQSSPADAAHQQLTALFNQKEDASLASLKQFKDAAADKADMRFWSNSNSALSTVPMLNMSKASELFKDTYTAGVINFEDGKADLDIKTYPNAILADTLKKYAGPTVDMDLLNKYPGAVNGHALFSFNPKLLVSILDYAGVIQTANQFLQNQGYTLDDITKAFKGDFAVIFSNISTQQKEIEGNKIAVPTAHVIIDAAIGDKASYDKIVKQLAKNGLMVEKNGQYQPEFLDDNPAGFKMYADAKNIVFSSDSVLLAQYVSGSGKVSLPSNVTRTGKGNAISFYVDIASILNAVPQDSSASAQVTSQAKQTFKDATAYSDNYGSGVIKSHVELRTTNDKENSLATLTRYFGSLSETMKRIRNTTGVGDVSIDPPVADSSQNR